MTSKIPFEMENNIYHILFPYLKLSFNLSPVAFEIGSISIKWYGIIIAVGFLVAYFYMNFRKTDFGFSGDDIADFVLVPSALAIIFARIYYIIFYPGDFYLKNPAEIIKISHGGILKLRSFIYPVVNIATSISYYIILIGFIFG